MVRFVRTIIISKWPYRFIRWGLALIFLYSGWTKFMAPQSFAVIIEAYGLAPITWINPLAVGIPALEIIAAFGLLFDVRGSLGVITGLLMFFMAIIGYGIWMGFDLNCGCFKASEPGARVKGGLFLALYRDIAMMAGICYLYLWRYKQSTSLVGLRIPLKRYLK